MDHAVWRYCLRQLRYFLAQKAHGKYLEGLSKTGITIEEIPSIDGICQKLNAFGWGAVPVSGFLPPAIFMEMQSLGILPIAREIRKLEHISYTPAPDIVHEAGGHAPFLAYPPFASYLKKYAQISRKALISKQDLAQYKKIRELSDKKGDPSSTEDDIQQAERDLDNVTREIKFVSEAAQLARMNWWTAEYGLVGSLENPKIYGAGLLSSLGEAKSCLSQEVEKIPFSLNCINYAYDITEKQPQLFVISKFEDLEKVLGQLSETMAYKRGGVYGLCRARESETVNTIELNSGLQISGLLTNYTTQNGQCVYYRFTGPTQLSFENKELPGHGVNYHSQGFSSPLGGLKNSQKCLCQFTDSDLASRGWVTGQNCELVFNSGVRVQGRLESTHRTVHGLLALMSFSSCRVSLATEVLFDPSWGVFDMAVGCQVQSVFSGPADSKNYGLTEDFFTSQVRDSKDIQKQDPKNKEIHLFYQEVREKRKKGQVSLDFIQSIFNQVRQDFPKDWLLSLELLELCHGTASETSQFRDLVQSLSHHLKDRGNENPREKIGIQEGLDLAQWNTDVRD